MSQPDSQVLKFLNLWPSIFNFGQNHLRTFKRDRSQEPISHIVSQSLCRSGFRAGQSRTTAVMFCYSGRTEFCSTPLHTARELIISCYFLLLDMAIQSVLNLNVLSSNPHFLFLHIVWKNVVKELVKFFGILFYLNQRIEETFWNVCPGINFLGTALPGIT